MFEALCEADGGEQVACPAGAALLGESQAGHEGIVEGRILR